MWGVADVIHGLDTVDDRIDEHLLKLDPIAEQRRQPEGKLEAQRNPMN
jgi:hypothetical protein